MIKGGEGHSKKIDVLEYLLISSGLVLIGILKHTLI